MQVSGQFLNDEQGIQSVTFGGAGGPLDASGVRHKMLHDTMQHTATAVLRLPAEATTLAWDSQADRDITVADLGTDNTRTGVIEIHGYAAGDVTVNSANAGTSEIEIQLPNGKTINLVGQAQDGTSGVALLRFVDGGGNMTSEVDPNSYY